MDDYRDNPQPAKVIPVFFTEPVEMVFRSKQEGRPIFEDQEFVKILIPGDRNSSPVQPVDEEVKRRWPQEYAAFKAGEDIKHEGTPLTQWPPISRSQVEEFKFYNVHTVEHLAAVNDAQIQKMPMGTRDLQKAARLFLDAAKNGTGPLLKLAAENTRLSDKVEAQERTIAELAASIKQMEASRARAD